jgi:hypothetical protein
MALESLGLSIDDLTKAGTDKFDLDRLRDR